MSRLAGSSEADRNLAVASGHEVPVHLILGADGG